MSFWRPWRQNVHVELGNVTDSNLRLQDLHLSQPEADLEEAEQVLFEICQETFLIQVDDGLLIIGEVLRVLIWISTLILLEERVSFLHKLDHTMKEF